MDTGSVIAALQEFAFVLIAFLGFLFYAVFLGRQAVINLILGLYLALLISLVFPYTDSMAGEGGNAYRLILLFAFFTLIGTLLMRRLMPDEYKEKKFESFHKKIMLALGGTIVVLIFSFNVLPVSEIVSINTPFESLFASKEYFFWWLLVPLIFLYLN